ncbi:MAG: 4Fe-4S binding protein [Dehalococcoidales bacterium]|nr:4Fe-4S binding protein [Dehalococcoidales bacterium]
MESENDVYRKLQLHLNKSPVGYPPTSTGAEIRLLKHIITPEEAGIALYIDNETLEPAETIYKRIPGSLKLSLDDLKAKLDHMAYKGILLVYSEGRSARHYKLAGVTAGGMTDFQVNRLTKDLVDDFDQYHHESFGEAENTGAINIPQLRAIPVEKSIPLAEKHMVSSYDDVRKLVEKAPGPISIAPCVCRQMADLRGEPCKASELREWCLQIGPDHVRQYVEMGCGRYITKEEAYEILEKAEKVGLILQPENSKNPENICMCCGDCCGLLSIIKNAPRPVDFYATNFYAVVDTDLCKGCGTCVKRCQLGARKIENNKAVVMVERCIGCGACVTGCESGASQMRKKDVETVPFETKDDMFSAIKSAKKPGGRR